MIPPRSEIVVTPSPGTPGEGWGEGDSDLRNALDVRNHPHPDPLPEHRERGQEIPRPMGLVAELTYRCPLHCPYCSNPLHSSLGEELTTGEWARVFDQA